MTGTILVSACLLGLPTRYDGGAKRHQAVLDWLAARRLTPIPLCPEQLAGLPTPRLRCCFTVGDGAAILDGWGEARSEDGRLVNDLLRRGAAQALTTARLCSCHAALLKEGSPSCGVQRIDRSGERVTGQGVTAALLQRHGLRLYSEETLPETGEPS